MRRSALWKVGFSIGAPVLCLVLAETALAQEEAPEKETEVVVVRTPGIQVSGQRGYLGVLVDDVTASDVEELDLAEERGARVTEVLEESPAARAGLQEDDVILAWNREPIESVAELTRLSRETPPGREVRVEVVRGGEEREFTVQLGERPSRATVRFGPDAGFRFHAPEGLDEERMERLQERMAKVREKQAEAMERLHEQLEDVEIDIGGDGVFYHLRAGGKGRMGVALQSLTDQLAEYFGVSGDRGALVSSVREGSPAAKAGVRAGDVIVSVDGQEVDGPGDVIRYVREAEAGPVPLTVVRERERRTLTVELPEPEQSAAVGACRCGEVFHRARGVRVRPLRANPLAVPRPPTPPRPLLLSRFGGLVVI